MVSEISAQERNGKIKRIQDRLKERDIDAYLVHGTESDFANIFYLSNHWPVWETCGIIIPRDSDPILLIGAEAKPFAENRSSIKDIRMMWQYRESAEPEYPGIPLSSFEEIFDEINGGEGVKRLGLGDYTILPMPVYYSVEKALGDKGEIVRAEEIISDLRIIKSEDEIELIRKAHKITEKVLDEILGKIKPGFTEKEVVGMVLEAIYRNGAECEAFSQYIFSGKNTRHAISRTTFKKLQKNEMIQINIGARFGGYSSAIGRPLVIGKMDSKMKRHVQFGLDAHLKTYEWIKEGVEAKEVAIKFEELYKKSGYEDSFLYGPCHGTGIIEVEKPWLETNSEYRLKENMTFMADTFFITSEYGFRWEDGFKVTKSGVDTFSDKWQQIIEI